MVDGPSSSSLTTAKRSVRNRAGRTHPAREKKQKLQKVVREEEKERKLLLLPPAETARCEEKWCGRTEMGEAFIGRGVRLCKRCFTEKTANPKWHARKGVHLNNLIQHAETETLRRVRTSPSSCPTMPRAHTSRVHNMARPPTHGYVLRHAPMPDVTWQMPHATCHVGNSTSQ